MFHPVISPSISLIQSKIRLISSVLFLTAKIRWHLLSYRQRILNHWGCLSMLGACPIQPYWLWQASVFDLSLLVESVLHIIICNSIGLSVETGPIPALIFSRFFLAKHSSMSYNQAIISAWYCWNVANTILLFVAICYIVEHMCKIPPLV